MRVISTVSFAVFALAAGMLFAAGSASAADGQAARKLARANNCFRCHAIEKKKEGPTWLSIADKYHGKADAEDRLMRHLTVEDKAEFPDKHEEYHKLIKTNPPNDTAQIKNLVDWILSL
jgi:cytochrome c